MAKAKFEYAIQPGDGSTASFSGSGIRAMIAAMLICLWPALAPAQVDPAPADRAQTSERRKQINRFIETAPQLLLSARETLRLQSMAHDSGAAALRMSGWRMARMYLGWHDEQLASNYAALQDFPEDYPETLEFYDTEVKSAIHWYLRFLQQPIADSLQGRYEAKKVKHIFDTLGIDDWAGFREKATVFYHGLLVYAERVPLDYRQNYRERNRQLDLPPVPEGGFAALQQALQQQWDAAAPAWRGLVFVEALIGADGRVLRSRLRSSTGYAALDSLARQIIADAKWRPGMRGTKPVKAEIAIPIRFWRGDGHPD